MTAIYLQLVVRNGQLIVDGPKRKLVLHNQLSWRYQASVLAANLRENYKG